MSIGVAAVQTRTQPLPLVIALEQIAARAESLDANPRFPTENMQSLRTAGVPQLAADRERCVLAREIALVRALAGVDASTARIVDGHFNGVERLYLHAPENLRERELEAVAGGTLLLGVWGADPALGEGSPATIERGADGALVLRGVKTFCSGAGGVQRALVLARDEQGARRVAYVDASRDLQIDRDWYRASGLRASESHRVEFHDAPVLATLGGENELIREPYFSRDAVRTAATWAGIADCILRATLTGLRDVSLDDLQLHAVGRMRVALGTIDRWLAHAEVRLELPAGRAGVRSEASERAREDLSPTSLNGGAGALAVECRVAIADAAREIAAQAMRACGARALVGGGILDRARRDLDLFVLQHRLDPKLLSLGRLAFEGVAGE
jgi:alkylation response protein AidB-like acyl-CoA dehydrogenase